MMYPFWNNIITRLGKKIESNTIDSPTNYLPYTKLEQITVPVLTSTVKNRKPNNGTF